AAARAPPPVPLPRIRGRPRRGGMDRPRVHTGCPSAAPPGRRFESTSPLRRSRPAAALRGQPTRGAWGVSEDGPKTKDGPRTENKGPGTVQNLILPSLDVAT